MLYSKNIRIEFNHCDPAGIVFYPRYFEMINSVIETFFADEIGLSFAQIHTEPGSGLPTIDIHAKFLSPSRLNETLRFTLEVHAVGRSSLTLLIKAMQGTSQRLSVKTVLIWMQGWKSQSWPTPLREKLLAFRPAPSTEPDNES